MALFFAADITLNPGPVNRYLTREYKLNVLNSKALHIFHLIINSLLPKNDELSYTGKSSNVEVIGISETDLDNTFYDSEVAKDGYNLV